MSDDEIDYFVCPLCKKAATVDRWFADDDGVCFDGENIVDEFGFDLRPTEPDELICPECCKIAKIPERMEGPIPVQACLFCEGKGVVK